MASVAVGSAKAGLRAGRAKNRAAATTATQVAETRGFRVSRTGVLGIWRFAGYWGLDEDEAAPTTDNLGGDCDDHENDDDDDGRRREIEEMGLGNCGP